MLEEGGPSLIDCNICMVVVRRYERLGPLASAALAGTVVERRRRAGAGAGGLAAGLDRLPPLFDLAIGAEVIK